MKSSGLVFLFCFLAFIWLEITESKSYDYPENPVEEEDIYKSLESILKDKEDELLKDDYKFKKNRNRNQKTTEAPNAEETKSIIKQTSSLPTVQTTTTDSLPSASISNESENTNSWTMFFILCVLAFSILLIHFLIQAKFHYLPESVAVVFLGAIIGLMLKLLSQWKVTDWSVCIQKSSNFFYFRFYS